MKNKLFITLLFTLILCTNVIAQKNLNYTSIDKINVSKPSNEILNLSSTSLFIEEYSPVLKNEISYRLNTFSLSFLNYASVFSISYERLLILHHIGSWSGYASGLAGIGFSGSEPLQRDDKMYLSFPHHLTYVVGFNPLKFEAGIGGSIIYGQRAHHFGIAGLRFHSLKQHRIQLRLFVQAPFTTPNEYLFITKIGWSIGFNL